MRLSSANRMKIFDAARTAELLPWGALVDALETGL